MERILRILERTAIAGLAALLVLWAADWAVFAWRAAHGEAYAPVQVQEYLSTALKGNKNEYDYLGTTQVNCSRSLFPHGGANPCWWQRRHTQEWE